MKLSNRKRFVGYLLLCMLCSHVTISSLAQNNTETWDFAISSAGRVDATNELLATYQGFIALESSTQGISHVETTITECQVEKDTAKSGSLLVPESMMEFVYSTNVWKVTNPQQYTFHHKRILAGLTSYMLAALSLDDQRRNQSTSTAWWWEDAALSGGDTLLIKSINWKPKRDTDVNFIFEKDGDVFCVTKTWNGYDLLFVSAMLPHNANLARDSATNKMISARNVFTQPSLSKTIQFAINEIKLSKRKQ